MLECRDARRIFHSARAFAAYHLKLVKHLICLTGGLQLALSDLRVVPVETYLESVRRMESTRLVVAIQKTIEKIEENASIRDILERFEGPIQ